MILNEQVGILSAQEIAYKVNEHLCRENENGDFAFSNVATVLIIDEKHYAQVSPDLKVVPIVAIQGSGSDNRPDIDQFLDEFMQQWAEYNNIPLLPGKAPDILMDLKNFHLPKEQPTKMKRSEAFVRQYQQNPYLRHLTKSELVHHGKRILERLMPHFLKNHPKLEPDQLHALLAKFTHFNEEMRFRGIDFREINISS